MTQGTVPVNAEASEVALEVTTPNGDVLETWVLHFGTNAICRLESLLGTRDHLGNVTPVPVEKLMTRLSSPSYSDVRAMIAAGLGDRHHSITLEAAGNLIDKIGIQTCIARVDRAIKAAFPQPDPEAGAEGKGQAVPGSGNGSSKRRPRQASPRVASGN